MIDTRFLQLQTSVKQQTTPTNFDTLEYVNDYQETDSEGVYSLPNGSGSAAINGFQCIHNDRYE